ncbi:MAG: rhodanese-like domain-containing protein [Bacteroidales bacterium]|nr:rhodanese-like domain-containing protein [Bacteroidales bacterium]
MNNFEKELDNRLKAMPWPVVMPAQFNKLINKGVNMAIIDVREPEDCCFEDERIDCKHIYNVPFNSLVTELPNLDLSSYDYIFTICTAGPKGAVAASIARWMDMENVFFVKGGIVEIDTFR